MKKLLALLLLLTALLISGCDGETPEQTDPTETTGQAAPLTTWIEDQGLPWDEEGALLEIPLSVPGGMHYSSFVEFDGDLLLWSTDNHLENTVVLELCLLDLDSGKVSAMKDLSFGSFMTVQVLEDSLFLASSEEGVVYKLDKSLDIVQTWETEPANGSWYMGGNEKLYIFDWDGSVTVRNLTTGENIPLLEGEPYIDYFSVNGEQASVEYFRVDTGAPACAVVNLLTGEIMHLDARGEYISVSRSGNHWLYGTYYDSYTWYLQEDGGEEFYVDAGGGYLELIGGGQILYVSEESTYLTLCDTYGNALARCRMSEQAYNYTYSDLIWSETFGGYFFMLSGYAGDHRLMFWDISKGETGDNLNLEPIPEETEANALLKQRAQELSEKYGLTILVADDCDTSFDEFSASHAMDYEYVSHALDILDEALSIYPEGFFRQLRYGSMRGIRIHLVTDLMADGSGRYGDGYVAFAQDLWDHYIVVIDIEDSDHQTYYHEFSHVIDSFLEWDSMQRDDALYSEEGWAELNPDWFTGYSYDYSQEHYLEDFDSFVDCYATVSPTEDRARVMEYAMMEYGFYTFEGCEGLQEKLDYYCRCIRDAFDTTNWPETLPWEQYLTD